MYIPEAEPSEIIAGETVKWRKSHSDYSPAAGWALKYYLRGPGSGTGKGLNLTQANSIAVDGSGWLITIPAVSAAGPTPPPATDQLVTGDYYWEAWVESGADKYRIGAGKLLVKQSLSALTAATAYDGRSQTKQTLDAIRAAIAGRASAAQTSRTVGNTTIQFMSMEDLIAAETRFQQLYNSERRAARLRAGEPLFKTVHTRFVPNE